MTRYGMLINTKKCVGCYACRMACQMINKLEPEEAFISYKEIEQGTYPSVYAETVPVQCMHCEDAPCEAVCPTHATYTTDSGVVLVDEERCIGCKYCYQACPFGVPTYSSAAMASVTAAPWAARARATPRVAPRPGKFGALHFGTVDELLAQCPDAKVVEASTKPSFYLA